MPSSRGPDIGTSTGTEHLVSGALKRFKNIDILVHNAGIFPYNPLADMGSIGKKLYYWNPNHSPRSMVEKVDFVSAAGYLDGGDARERLGLQGGPELVVSDLAVMDFHPVSKKMRLRSTHQGVTIDQITEATGFELLMPGGAIPETRQPTQEQVRVIREVIDPDSMRKREFRQRIQSHFGDKHHD